MKPQCCQKFNGENQEKETDKKSYFELRTASKTGLKDYSFKEFKFNLIILWSNLFLRDKLLSKTIRTIS